MACALRSSRSQYASAASCVAARITFAVPKPWSAEIPMRKTAGPIYEYACHEGNYGMFGILDGARAVDKREIDAAKKGSN